MEITLTPGAEAVVRQTVTGERFATAAEAVEAAMSLLDTRDRYEYLRSLILAAEQEIQDGTVVEWTPEIHLQWRAEAEARLHEEVPFDPHVCP